MKIWKTKLESSFASNFAKASDGQVEVDEDGLKEELAEQVKSGDADEALQRMEDLGIEIDELDL